MDRLLQARAMLAQPDSPTLLVTHTGLPFQLARFAQYWDEMLATWGAPARFPPQKLRHIYVEERCSHDAAPVSPAIALTLTPPPPSLLHAEDHVNLLQGPADYGAAMIMGNSTRTWQVGGQTCPVAPSPNAPASPLNPPLLCCRQSMTLVTTAGRARRPWTTRSSGARPSWPRGGGQGTALSKATTTSEPPREGCSIQAGSRLVQLDSSELDSSCPCLSSRMIPLNNTPHSTLSMQQAG